MTSETFQEIPKKSKTDLPTLKEGFHSMNYNTIIDHNSQGHYDQFIQAQL